MEVGPEHGGIFVRAQSGCQRQLIDLSFIFSPALKESIYGISDISFNYFLVNIFSCKQVFSAAVSAIRKLVG